MNFLIILVFLALILPYEGFSRKSLSKNDKGLQKDSPKFSKRNIWDHGKLRQIENRKFKSRGDKKIIGESYNKNTLGLESVQGGPVASGKPNFALRKLGVQPKPRGFWARGEYYESSEEYGGSYGGGDYGQHRLGFGGFSAGSYGDSYEDNYGDDDHYGDYGSEDYGSQSYGDLDSLGYDHYGEGYEDGNDSAENYGDGYSSDDYGGGNYGNSYGGEDYSGYGGDYGGGSYSAESSEEGYGEGNVAGFSGDYGGGNTAGFSRGHGGGNAIGFSGGNGGGNVGGFSGGYGGDDNSDYGRTDYGGRGYGAGRGYGGDYAVGFSGDYGGGNVGGFSGGYGGEYGGYSYYEDEPRIAGGVEAKAEEVLFIVAILYKQKIRCTGVIYNEHWVVATGWCVTGMPHTQLQVRVGSLNHAAGGCIHRIKTVKVPQAFRLETCEDHNIGLIKVSPPIEFIGNVKKATLAPGEIDHNKEYAITGWGAYQNNSKTPSKTLRQAKVKWMDFEKCKNNIRGIFVTKTHFCTHNPAKGYCEGDIGAPLHEGLTVFGLGILGSEDCTEPLKQTVFSKFGGGKANGGLKEWIDESIKSYKLE